MLTARPVKMVLSLLLIFALSLFASGCGSANEEKVIGESATQAAVSAEETADHSDSEIPDKFVMLKEVYNILSSPLGEPYRTPEYWGGEEIDMMKAGANYLIGLRNVQNQMHYLLYERETDSIIEIDTQGKHIPWDEIIYSNSEQNISFPYYIPDTQTQKVRNGVIYYSISNHSYQYTESDNLSLSRPENLFEIPTPTLTQKNQTFTFDFLFDIIEKLPEIYFSDQHGWWDFGASNICILHNRNHTLIRLEGQWDSYYVYQSLGTVSAITPLDVPNTFWDVIRFQQDDEYWVFPSLSGQKFPYAYWDPADFPYTTLVSPDVPTWSEKQKTPLWREDERVVYQVGKPYCRSEWNSILYRDDSTSFALYLAEDSHSTCDCSEEAPEILVETNPDRTVSVWIKNGKLSDEIQQELLSCQMEGITDIRIQQDICKEEYKKHLDDFVKKTGIQIQFTLKNGYQLYGEFKMDEDYFSREGKLELFAKKIGNSRKKYYQISNYQYLYSTE